MGFSFGIDETFAASVFGAPSQTTTQFLTQHAQAAFSKLGEVGTHFMQKTLGVIQQYASSDYAIKASRLASELGHQLKDSIRELLTVRDFRRIQPMMAQYIAASPHFRELYAKRLTSGYGDAVVNGEWAPLVHVEDPTVPVEQITAYRRYADGDYVETDTAYTVRFFGTDPELDPDGPMPQNEKFAVRDTIYNACYLSAYVDDIYSVE